MDIDRHAVTRGYGLLETFLARQRASRADSLIPESARTGKILDIGCGSYPAFLINTRFADRYGLDRVSLPDVKDSGLKLVAHDIDTDGSDLPFSDGFFEVVTMLAVFEHLEPATVPKLLREIGRVLTAGGTYVMTTPVRGTEGILKLMSHLKLVSHEEVSEHKAQYSRGEIVNLLLEAGFDQSRIRHGTFEFGMNVWAAAKKSG